MQFGNWLFDRAASDQAVNGQGVLLYDPVSTVGGLIFDGRVSPGIHLNDVVGGGQIQTRAASFAYVSRFATRGHENCSVGASVANN